MPFKISMMNDWLACFGFDKRLVSTQSVVRVSCDDIIVFESGECRFPNDRLMTETDRLVIVLDGLILNLKELLDAHHAADLKQLVEMRWAACPERFFNDFRGPFTGLVYDKIRHKAVVFTNQTGDSAVFCYEKENLRVFSSNFDLLSRFLRENRLPVSFNPKAAHWMLTFGFLIDDATFISEVRRLCAGKATNMENGRWKEYCYHRFETETLKIAENEAIEQIDSLFRMAVKRCFDKDLDYGYTHHLADMSAGMDSRMTNCIAKALGYDNITNISYSQTGSEEAILSAKASALFGNELIFRPLDDHDFIFDIDKLTRENFGTYLYCGITGGERLLASLDFDNFGAEHTGQLGDIAIGTFVKSNSNLVNPDLVRLSHRIPLNSDYDPNAAQFENLDLYSLYTRGFQGAMSSWFIRKRFTFALSPFTDVDFMGFCYSLPLAYRRNHNLYWKWVQSHYPMALEVKTSRKHVPVTTFDKTIDLSKRAIHKAEKMTRTALFDLGLTKSRVSSVSSMNPYDYWFDTDPAMREFFNAYYSSHITLFDDMPDLKADIKTMFDSPAMLDKLMALTVLSARSVFF